MTFGLILSLNKLSADIFGVNCLDGSLDRRMSNIIQNSHSSSTNQTLEDMAMPL